jgi:phage gpG-like protein
VADLDGMDAMLNALEGISAKVYGGTPDALAQAGHLVEGLVKQELSRSSHPRGTPTPSAPGSPPSLISGALRRSIQVEGPQQLGGASWTVSVGTNIVYGPIQERGGMAGHARLPARPYMYPGLMAALPGFESLMVRTWADALS